MIEVQNLTKYYKDFRAVNNISMTIRKGEILGLLGPNGAGKTTTLRMLTGYFRPTSGSIKIKDYQMPDDSLKIKSLIGYLPESAPLYHNMLVYDYLDYVARIKGLSEKEARYDRMLQLSDLCGLSGIMARPIANLSKGLKQRVGLAHAMMNDPEILILDEPTSGLDPNQIADIRDIIRTIGKEKTIIFSTHILSEAEATCDRIVIINKGRVAADDTTENLKKNATHSSFIRLCLSGADEAAAKELLSQISEPVDIKAIPSEGNGICRFEIRSQSDTDLRSQIYLKIKETDWVILELCKETQALEKIFQELTMEEEDE